MQVKVSSPARGTAVVQVSGGVDLSNAAALRTDLMKALKGSKLAVVDLSGLNFIDSTGLGVLVGRLRAQLQMDGELRLVITSERILRNFRITGLDKIFAIFESVDAALEAS